MAQLMHIKSNYCDFCFSFILFLRLVVYFLVIINEMKWGEKNKKKKSSDIICGWRLVAIPTIFSIPFDCSLHLRYNLYIYLPLWHCTSATTESHKSCRWNNNPRPHSPTIYLLQNCVGATSLWFFFLSLLQCLRFFDNHVVAVERYKV